MFGFDIFKTRKDQNLKFITNHTESPKGTTQELLCGAKVAHVNMATGGMLYSSVPKEYEGPCSVSDVSYPDRQRRLAVLPTYKAAQKLAFVAIMPNGGYSQVLVKPSKNPVTHQSYIDWL